MKRTIPILIAAICGTVLIITAFIPATVAWGEIASVWFDILAAIAFVLGGGNLLKIHLKKISDKSAGWAYSFVTVATFLATLFFGLMKWGVPPTVDQEFYGQTFAHHPVEQLPESLIFRQEVDLTDDFRENMPKSVEGQLEYETEGDRLTALTFRGWMTAAQEADLKNAHLVLEWQCAVEQLADTASLPPELQGDVAYYADHSSLSVTGNMTPEVKQQLEAISNDERWQATVERLEQKSSQKTTITLSNPPAQFAIPEQYQQQLTLEGSSLTVTGPLTPAMKAELTEIFPHTKPLSEDEVQQFVESMGDLTGDQVNILVGLLNSSWNAEQLIGVLNDAGKRPESEKSACELLAEQQQGETNLAATIPSAEPDVTLNEEQADYLQSAVLNANDDLAGLGAALAERGEFLPAQQVALTGFLARTPTVGERNRLIAMALTAGGQTLTADQYEILLADYRAEHLWREQIYQLYEKSHRVKYGWSGNYNANGSPFWWSYEYAFKPLTATMFALLAFYVASAAFRAFRAKNLEAFLLLGTAFIVLVGRTYFGVWLTSGLPESLSGLRIENITMFIMTVINTAGNRAIMIGISLGIVSTSLKILLGVDRSYLGGGDE